MCYVNLCCHVSCVASRVMRYVNSYLREFFLCVAGWTRINSVSAYDGLCYITSNNQHCWLNEINIMHPGRGGGGGGGGGSNQTYCMQRLPFNWIKKKYDAPAIKSHYIVPSSLGSYSLNTGMATWLLLYYKCISFRIQKAGMMCWHKDVLRENVGHQTVMEKQRWDLLIFYNVL